MTDPAEDLVPESGAAADREAVAFAREHQATIDSLWDFDDPAGSQARFLAAAQNVDGADRDVLLTQVARAMGLQEEFIDATELLASLPIDLPELDVRSLLERGRVLNSEGDSAGARPLFEDAFEAARAAGFEFLAVDALHMLALVAPAEEQDELNRRALALAESALDPRARQWRASLLNNLGWSAFDRGELDAALALFEEAVVERAAQGKQSELLIARWCVARTLREMGRVDEALVIQQELAAAHRAAGTSDPYVDEELAELQQARQSSTTPDPGSG